MLAGTMVTRLTETAAVIGTLPYMSPEQRRGRRDRSPLDLFSAGVMLYEAATGALPQGAFAPPSEMNRAYGRAFDRIVIAAPAGRSGAASRRAAAAAAAWRRRWRRAAAGAWRWRRRWPRWRRCGGRDVRGSLAARSPRDGQGQEGATATAVLTPPPTSRRDAPAPVDRAAGRAAAADEVVAPLELMKSAGKAVRAK